MNETTIRGGVHLMGTAFEVRIPLPVVISESIRIQRPNDGQMKLIDKVLSWMDLHGYAREHFETVATLERRADGTEVIHRTALPKDEQRYLLVTHSGTGTDVYTFLTGCQLVAPTLWSLLHIYTREPFGMGDWAGHGADTLMYQRKIGEWVRGEPHPVLDGPAVERISATYNALRCLDRTAHPGIWRAAELFSLFARMSFMELFDALAMFMLIEMLLTHNPGDQEIGDSLTHQVRQKIPFVFERLGRKIDYSMFQKAKPETIWTKLYAYRSKIAHGETVDFQSQLEVLVDAQTANRFLTGVTRDLIRLGLDDPKLLEGLKPI
jgi:hypothetical protein